MRCPLPKELVFFIDGGATQERGAWLENHLAQCASCRGQVEDTRATVAELTAHSPAYKDTARRDRILAAIEAEEVTPHRPRLWRDPRWLWGIGFGAAASTVLIATLLLPALWTETPEFQARTTSQTQWVGLHAYRIGKIASSPSRVHDSIAADDQLLFSYTNLEGRGLRWLAIVARDTDGHFFWYQPESTTGVTGIPIDSGVSGREIPQAVRFPLAAGTLHLAGIFSSQPLERQAVETWLEEVSRGNRAQLPRGATTDLLRLNVSPAQAGRP